MSNEELRKLAHKTLDAYLDAGGPFEFVIVSQADYNRNEPYWSRQAPKVHFKESDFDIPVTLKGDLEAPAPREEKNHGDSE